MLVNFLDTNKVMLFTKSWCPYSKKVITILNDKNVKYGVFEIDTNEKGEEMQKYLIDKSGQRTVPYVYIGKKLIGGDDEFEKGVKNGSVKATLNQLGVKNDF